MMGMPKQWLEVYGLDKILVSMIISFWFCEVNSARQIFRPKNELKIFHCTDVYISAK